MNPVVIDHGSYKCRAGFASDDAPRADFLSLTGRPKTAESGIANHRQPIDTFVGARLLPLVDELQLCYPIEHGNVTNWDDVEHIWRHTFSEELRVDPNEHPVVLTEPARNPKVNREKMTTLMFETFDVPAFYLAQQCVLALYSTGRTDGIVLDCGHTVTHVVPVKDGCNLKMGNRKLDFGGAYVTDLLRKSLEEKGILFKLRSEYMTVREIAERCCYTATDFDSEDKDYDKLGTDAIYHLPDGTVIQLGAERFQSVELFFHPTKFGFECYNVHELINDSITKLNDPSHQELFSNIVLAGGGTMYSKFEERLQLEMNKINQNARVLAPENRALAAWHGGASLASLSDFSKLFITKDEYDEFGPEIVHRRYT